MMLDLERLRKIWTLVERGGSAGERAAAKDRACAIAGRHGYVLEDIPVLLAGGNVHRAREVHLRTRPLDLDPMERDSIEQVLSDFSLPTGAARTSQIDLDELLLGTTPATMPAPEPARILWDRALGKRIRHRRIQLGLSMGAVAADIGCTYQQVQKYELGRNAVKAALLPVLSETLIVPVTGFSKVQMHEEYSQTRPILWRHKSSRGKGFPFFIHCSGCATDGPLHDDAEAAREAWNTRQEGSEA